MRKKEQRLWDAMKRNMPSGFWLQRVENVVTEGMPDVFAATRHTEASWVELKAPTAPRRATTRFLGAEGLRPAQINWHMKAANLYIRSFVLIRAVDRITLKSDRGLYLVPGTFAEQMNDFTRKEMNEISIADNWQKVFEVL